MVANHTVMKEDIVWLTGMVNGTVITGTVAEEECTTGATAALAVVITMAEYHKVMAE